MDYIKIVSELGFPIAITLFSLLRLEKALQELRDEIRKMSKKDQ